MAARRAEELGPLWAQGYNAGDLEALSALYEPGARLVPRPGEKPAEGMAAIREVLRGFLAQKGPLRMEIKTESVIEAGDIALLRCWWRLVGSGAEGKRVEITHRSAEVVRRQADGSWRYVVDNPFGAD
ncbi:MAG: SgcJ/EcaC family oxidoreductase [Gemmataceae bacterium]|nr:SgcJ/EcaC family oxidoreductase [Gemmataceae bacterium]